MARKYKLKEDRLMNAQVAISNSLTKEFLKTPLANFGYDEKRLQQGLELHKKAKDLLLQQKLKYAEQEEAVNHLKMIRGKAHKPYMTFSKVARVALHDDNPTLQKLDLVGKRKLPFAGWLNQVNQFYNVALSEPAVLDLLAGFGITKEKLTEGKKLADEAEAAHVRKEKFKAEALKATEQRDLTFKKLGKWMADFISIARAALVENPQALEALMVVQP
jgi:hypothetical protein